MNKYFKIATVLLSALFLFLFSSIATAAVDPCLPSYANSCTGTGKPILCPTLTQCCDTLKDCTASVAPPPAAGGTQPAPVNINTQSPLCREDCLKDQNNEPRVCNQLPSCTTGTAAGDPSKMLVNLSSLISDLSVLSGGKYSKLTSLSGIMNVLLPLLYVIAGIALLIYLIVGGFAYLTSAGDPKKMESAKTIITRAIMGFVLVIIAFWVTQIINYVFSLGAPV